ncbi:ANTAR domain-containing protein [Actinoplanes palleronii]|uniref:Transcriptional regulator n=1 Tax=Actinoplanes palleronii TaxID=113570 RepID=A0ABQ4BHH6_9ACTN|nr:GAF and ANTAR domain-containing protein [Actinoplanes palleronii]GIE70108.1 transcriptional regulator [Actinoplanes palleronii]
MTTVSAERLAAIFVEVADTLGDEFELTAFLQMLSVRAAGLADASAVGLMLADPQGRPELTAGSDVNVHRLQSFQLQYRDGPGLDAFRTGATVINIDLGAAGDRWPRFAARAARAGFGSVHAIPLRLRDQVIGAMSVFWTATGAGLATHDVLVLRALADGATIALLKERAISRSERLAGQLQGALNSRIVIEQAKGAIAERNGVPIDQAFQLLRSYARRNNQRLSELAHTIVNDQKNAPDLYA